MPRSRAHGEHPATPAREAFESGRVPLWVGPYRSSSSHGAAGSSVHSYAVILLITRGHSRIQHAGELSLQEGDVHLIPPGDPHGPAHAQDAEGWGLAFRPEAFAQGSGWGEEPELWLRPFLQIRGGCHPVLRPSAAQRRRLEGWLRAMATEFEGEARGRDEALTALLRLVLIELERIEVPVSAPVSAGLGLTRQVLSYIELNGLKPLSLADVAGVVGRTSTHVATVVRRETGRTVGDWILERRMAEARRRLRGTDERVDIIAERVGYADVTHFIRLFRRVHGLTPAAWRRKVLAVSPEAPS
ncbi:AraC family transcriptional regulator [Hyalangium rubrum]|uniref:AraC family transcriptional regulator n=1 Tax=Hyalangium rubrum TaxID=3103134 RepID=A0ABU5GYN1_9BACT|nr:AraC family transcriptional regulator [Hyalangium sp. s54d21]MDY7226307.1 AraC family transcriptional regulator [Hyalangium sp. s54d21]